VRLLDCGNSSGPLRLAAGESKRLWQAACADRYAEVISLSVAAPRRELGGAFVLRPSARIEWGGNGVTNVAEIDALSGIVMTVPAASITVTGQNDPIPATIGGNAAVGGPITMGVYAAYGDLNRQVVLTRTLYLDEISPGGAPSSFAVPAFSGNLTVIRAPLADAFAVAMLDSAGNIIGEWDVPANEQFPGPVHLPDDCSVIRIDPPNDPAFVARLVFGLEL